MFIVVVRNGYCTRFENDALYPRASLGELLGFAHIGAVDLRIVLHLARFHETSIELLAVDVVPFVLVRFQQIATTLSERDDAVTVAVEPFSTHKPLFTEMAKIARARIDQTAGVVLQIPR